MSETGGIPERKIATPTEASKSFLERHGNTVATGAFAVASVSFALAGNVPLALLFGGNALAFAALNRRNNG